jgi:hypothetical protein
MQAATSGHPQVNLQARTAVMGLEDRRAQVPARHRQQEWQERLTVLRFLPVVGGTDTSYSPVCGILGWLLF